MRAFVDVAILLSNSRGLASKRCTELADMHWVEGSRHAPADRPHNSARQKRQSETLRQPLSSEKLMTTEMAMGRPARLTIVHE